MAYADSQSVSVPGATSIPRVGQGLYTGVFQDATGNVKLTISHVFAKNGRIRRTIRLDHKKVAADPLNAAQNLNYSTSVYLVIDQPEIGYSVTEEKDIATGLMTWLTASTNANLIKALGGES